MKHIFVDESGKGNQFFLLNGLIVDNCDLVPLDRTLYDFRIENDLNNLKDLRNSNILKKIKIELTREIYEILEYYNVDLISVIIGNKTLNDITNIYSGKHKEVQKRYEPLKYLTERFYHHIDIRDQYGQVYFDRVDNEVKKSLDAEFNDLITRKGFQFPYRNKYEFDQLIKPSLLFVESDYDEIMQASDLVAYALRNSLIVELSRNKFDKINTSQLPGNLDYLEIYWPLFERSRYGNVKGYGIKFRNHNVVPKFLVESDNCVKEAVYGY